MALDVYSQFYYGHNVTQNNRFLFFEEGATSYTATLTIGSYTLTDFIEELARAMNSVGTLNYTTSLDRETRRITITGDSAFTLAISGTGSTTAIFNLTGFTGSSNLTGQSSYTGDSGSGSVFRPQFYLQDYVPTSINRNAVEATVNKSANGNIEVVQFGDEKFMKCNMLYITNIELPKSSVVLNNPTGLDDAIDFFNYVTRKRPVEFMENRTDPDTFEPLLLESTDASGDGVSYELQELFTRGLPEFYETGQVVFRRL